MVLSITYSFPGDAVEQFRIASVRFQQFAKRPFVGIDAELIEWFEDRTEAHYASEGSRGPGGRWPRWAPSTAARKKPGDRLMIVTGNLRGALVETSHPMAVRDIQPNRAEFGVDTDALPYAAYHQGGSEAGNLPRRRVVDMRKKDAEDLMKILQNVLVRRAREAGFVSGARASGVSRAF